MLAHYRLVEKIGEGGMGVVWRAVDTNLDREVAIKLLAEAITSEALTLGRFEREAKLLASVNHPNVATIYGLLEQEGVRFLAMELVPGEDLDEKLGDRPLAMGQALSIARQVAAALEATHERGVIHRDLKPANIYVTPGGEVRVLDFGIAQDIGPAFDDSDSRRTPTADRTQPGTVLGTIAYMSPEQARGKPLDERTDLWSFGCVLYKMLTGRQAFHGETRWDKLAAVLREDPDWDALPPETPDAIRDLLRRCLEKDPLRRPGEAREARRIIDDVLGTSSGSGEVPAMVRQQTTAHRYRTAVGLLIVVVAVATAGIILWRQFSPKDAKPEGAVASVQDRRSIAVLPFQSMGGGEENDAFTAGIHDDILNQIAKIGDLKVISRTSVMEYGEAPKGLKQIGEELGVATVLEGTVHRSGDQVRINVQLIDAASDENLWAERYDRELSVANIFAIQSDIAERIATALQAELSPAERRRIDEIPTEDLEAYDFYLRATEYLNRPGTIEENLIASRAMFNQAIELDPSFALAYAGLAEAAVDHYWLADGSPTALEAAVEAAEKAVELAPDLPEAHRALGICHYVRWDYDAAMKEFEIAEEGLPGNVALIKWQAFIMRRRGQTSEALFELERACALDPRDPEAAHEAALTLLIMRRYTEAEAYERRTLSLAPDYPAAHAYLAWIPVLRDGTPEAALEAANKMEALSGADWLYADGWRAMLYARQYDRAIEFVAPIERIQGQWHDYPRSLMVGWTYWAQGRYEEAAREFERARKILEAEVESRPDDARLRSSLGVAYAGLGRKADALREGKQAAALMPTEKDALVSGWMLTDLGWTYVMTDDPGTAAQVFDRVLSMPSWLSIEALLLDPRLDKHRDHAAFIELAAKHRRAS
jgi:non-specific serine/threonine protein kinase